MDASAMDQSAVVTLDVLHTGVIWGWFVTMNFWAKSVGTGVLLVGAFMMKRYQASQSFYRWAMPILGFLFINLTLLFTVLDLHQPLRFWHMFVWPHTTSAINIGSFLLSAYLGLLTVMGWATWKKKDSLFNALLAPTWILAFAATVYTAALLGQANAREVWSTPTEVAQTILAATLAGSAAFLLLGRTDREERTTLAWVLALSAVVAAVIFAGELVFAPQKSEEGAWVVHALMQGHLATLLFSGIALGFGVPALVGFWNVKADQPGLLKLAAVSGLVGLWLVKHAWLIAPQLIPLS